MNRQVNCQFFKDRLNAYLDSELDQETRSEMTRHADQCPDCGERLETMTRLLTMCAELDEGLAVPPDVQSAWRRAVREEAAKRRTPGRRGFTRLLGTVAAAFVLLVGGTFAYRIAGLPANELMGAQTGSTSAASGPNHHESYDESYDWASEQAPSAKSILLEPDGPADTGLVVGAPDPAGDAGGDAEARITIRSAQRRFESTAFDQTMQLITDLVDEYNGYFEQQSVNGQPLQPGQSVGRTASLTARVPAADLDGFLASLDAVGTLIYKGEQEEDISGSYYDAASRLNSYRAQLDRYNELVATAAGLEDMLLLQDKIYEVQLMIDDLEGQIKNWDSHANKASVYIDLTEVPVRDQVQPIGSTLDERVRSGFYDSLNWLSAFVQDAAVVLAMAAPALVVAIPLIIVICLIVSAVRRRRRRKGR